MGKRSDFERRPQDKYYTPASAVRHVRRFLGAAATFIEPCAGDGRLIRHVEDLGLRCLFSCDIEPDAGSTIMRADALQLDFRHFAADAIITNPPWTREILHQMINHFSAQLPTWLLFDADWAYTDQALPFLRACSHIIAVGKVKWIEGSKHSGMDNVAWYCFDQRHTHGPRFYGRNADA